MWGDRSGGRRADRRAFRPGQDCGLETRLLLSGSHQQNVFFRRGAPGQVGVLTARGGRSINIADADGELYRINVTNEATVRAIPTRDGRIDLVVNGSRFDSELTISRVAHPYDATMAHQFPFGAARANGVLRVRNITVKTGAIQSILGFGTVELSGRVTLRNPTHPDLTPTIDRLAFQAIRPGTRIDAAATINTVDVLTSANFDGPNDGIYTPLDLNLLNVRNDLNLLNGAAVQVGRDFGATPQPPKGTGTGGVGGNLGGNLNLTNGGRFVAVRRFASGLFVQGNVVVNGTVAATGPVNVGSSLVAPTT